MYSTNEDAKGIVEMMLDFDAYLKMEAERERYEKRMRMAAMNGPVAPIGEGQAWGMKRAGGMWHVKQFGRVVFSDPDFINAVNYIAGVD